MAHLQQAEYVKSLKKIYPHFFSKKKVLEVGSLNINGSIRDFFYECEYVGIDVGEGEGVDLVCEGQKYDAPNETFDVSCSAECFEHNPFWLETFLNMINQKAWSFLLVLVMEDQSMERQEPVLVILH